MIYEESRQNQKLGNLELGKDRIVEKETEEMLMSALKMVAERTLVDCVEKERKQSIMWLNNVKYLHKSITTFSDMIELVLFFT